MTAKKFEHYLERYRTAVYKTHDCSYEASPIDHNVYVNFKIPISYYRVTKEVVTSDEPRFMLGRWIFHVYIDAFLKKDEIIIIPRPNENQDLQ